MTVTAKGSSPKALPKPPLRGTPVNGRSVILKKILIARAFVLLLAAALVSAGACGESVEPPESEIDPDADLDMAAEDFECILDGTPVRRFFLTNPLGYVDEALAVANDPEGGVYPPGTIIQLVPEEAMVKRRRGWNAATNDWEFFALNVASDGEVTIAARGAEETVNMFGGNCFDCHALAEPRWDFVCEQDRGCDPLPFDEATIRSIQEADPRCR